MGRGSSKVGGGGGGSLSSRIANAGTLQQAMRIAEKNGIHLDSGVLKDVADEKLIRRTGGNCMDERRISYAEK